MPQINQNINNPYIQKDPRMQGQPLHQDVRIPNYYYVPDYTQMSLKESIKESPGYDFVLKPFIEHPIAIIASWLGLGYGVDAYSKACGGEYDKSLVKKVANLGDKIETSKFIQSKPMQSVLGLFSSAKKSGEKVVNNSAVLRAMRDTPTMPEWAMVKSQLFNQKQEVVQDFLRITDALKLSNNEIPKIKELGISNKEFKMLKDTFKFKKISDVPEKEIVDHLLLKRLGKSDAEINNIKQLGKNSTQAVKKEILKAMGMTTDKLKLIKEDVYGKYIDDVIKASGNVKGKVKIGAGHYGWMGPISKVFERTIGCDEIHNKLYSMSKGGAKTATGRFMSKAMQMIHRGLTFGGGKLGLLLFIAPILVELGINIKKADKDQKVGTAANCFVENVSWVFTFPLALKMLHSIGGIKYAGMSKTDVKAYRKLIKDFNDKTTLTILKDGKNVPNPNLFADKTAYNNAKDTLLSQLKALKNANKPTRFTKMMRTMASWITPDLEIIKPFQNSNVVANTGRKYKILLRNMGGIPIRFALWSAISMGVLGAGLTKITTSIFGKSYDSMKQDERKQNRKAQEKFLKEDLNKRLYETQRVKQYGTQKVQNNQAINYNNISSRGNNIPTNNYTNMYNGKKEYTYIPNQQNTINNKEINKNVKVDNYTYIPSPTNTIQNNKKKNSVDTYKYIPSSKNTIKSDKMAEKQRKYIPSQQAANITKTYDNSGLQSALDRAQKAEDNALRVLSGNFDGM